MHFPLPFINECGARSPLHRVLALVLQPAFRSARWAGAALPVFQVRMQA